MSERLPGYDARDKDVKRAEKLTNRIDSVRERMRMRRDCPLWFIEEMDDILHRANCLIGPLEHHRDELLQNLSSEGTS